MDIQAKNNSNNSFIFFITVLFFFSQAIYAEAPKEILLKSYEKNVNNKAESGKIIAELEKSISKCRDNHLASRIKYRIGVLYFRDGDYKKGYKAFDRALEAALEADIILSALNMKANCAMFSGKSEEAISCFQELLKKIQEQDSISEFNMMLAVSGYYSIAGLYEQAGDFAEAIRTYSVFINKYKHTDFMDHYVNKAEESKARLFFESGDINSYLNTLDEITGSNTPGNFKALFELQKICVDFIQKNGKLDGIASVAKIPAHAISIAASNSNCDTSELLRQTAMLSKRNINTKSFIYVNYFYGWLLDSSGKKQDALKAFRKVIDSCSKTDSREKYYYLGEYAKVQSAILSGELQDYNSAVKVIEEVEAKNSSHLTQISESVKNSLTVLKREVPKNDKIQ